MRQVGQHGRAVLRVGEGGERKADAKACLSDGRGCRGGGLVEEDVVFFRLSVHPILNIVAAARRYTP